MKRNITQQESILRYMQSHRKGITSKDAFERFGCTRLAAVIKNLERKGHKIVSTRELVKTRYGSTSIARYTLEA